MDDGASSALDGHDTDGGVHNCVNRQQKPLPPPPPPTTASTTHTVRDATASTTHTVRDATTDSAASDKFQKQFLKLMSKVYETIERNEIRLKRLDEREMLKLEWNLVAVIIDRLFLWLFIITTLAVTFGIIFKSPHAHEFIFKSRSSSSSMHSDASDSP